VHQFRRDPGELPPVGREQPRPPDHPARPELVDHDVAAALDLVLEGNPARPDQPEPGRGVALAEQRASRVVDRQPGVRGQALERVLRQTGQKRMRCQIIPHA
jgi:hypothetical protein